MPPLCFLSEAPAQWQQPCGKGFAHGADGAWLPERRLQRLLGARSVLQRDLQDISKSFFCFTWSRKYLKVWSRVIGSVPGFKKLLKPGMMHASALRLSQDHCGLRPACATQWIWGQRELYNKIVWRKKKRLHMLWCASVIPVCRRLTQEDCLSLEAAWTA